jgi:ribosomal protein S19
MSELIQQFTGKTLFDWEKWYLQKHPQAINKATQKILEMVKNLKNAMDEINEKIIEKWVKDLVIVKTFIGLRFQEAVLKKVAEIKKSRYRIANFYEEGKDIDGYIGKVPVSIKPETYKTKAFLPEKLSAKIIYYKKVKDGIEIDCSELL